ncbi:MAG: excinuclease ABC subunit UvrA [bacterium]
MKHISITGARVHNLNSVSVKIPKKKFVIITGVSGSGKSSLAFDTLYAEGQRRYVESLSSYARQFLGIMDKPDVDRIEGLSPSIAIGQRGISKNPRSTVATTTEIYDYLRVLFARTGDPYCYNCGRPVREMAIDEIIDDIMSMDEGTRIEILAPIVVMKKGEHAGLLEKLMKRGFTRVIIDGKAHMLGDKLNIDSKKKHDIEIVIDRLKIGAGIRTRLTQSVETALKETDGIIYVLKGSNERIVYNQSLSCTHCMISYQDITPATFSFNSPYGACPKCHGLGVSMEIDSESVITDPSLSIAEGAIAPWGEPSKRNRLNEFMKRFNIDADAPWEELSPEIRSKIILGPGESRKDETGLDFEGVLPYLKRLYINTDSSWMKYEIEKYMTFQPCPVCNGSRLNREALSVKIAGMNIHDIVMMNIEQAYHWFTNLKLEGRKQVIARDIVRELRKRLSFLLEVGLSYITLDRKTETLSGGEEQRVRLATQIGSGLTGVLYILDEPSVGLHQRDINRLIQSLKNLRDMDNTVIVVEHDNAFIDESDYIVDLGPYAGDNGGNVIFTGTTAGLKKSSESLTGRFISGRESIRIERKRKKPRRDYYLEIKGAREHNLKNIDVKIPLGLFNCITGVSGSGKSTLINDILFKSLRSHFHSSLRKPGEHDSIKNLHLIDKVINITQTPIGRTPRSNPATYTGVFTPIRELFASMKESRMRGYKPGRFSFNVKGGRCEACEGTGVNKIEMHFLPDIYVNCEVCKGRRYNRQTLQVKYRGKNIAEVLDMTVDSALKHFSEIRRISKRLKLLQDVGLGYIRLGQPATSLSGGEAQRIKLAKELSKQSTGRTLYLLDEPTTGLHPYDIKMLLGVLDRLVRKGNTLVVIEHNLDVIRSADRVIDLGPDGGESGGMIVAEGTPEEIEESADSYTGHYLKKEGMNE